MEKRRPLKRRDYPPIRSGGRLVLTIMGVVETENDPGWVVRVFQYPPPRNYEVHLQNHQGFFSYEPIQDGSEESVRLYLLSWSDHYVWSFVVEELLTFQRAPVPIHELEQFMKSRLKPEEYDFFSSLSDEEKVTLPSKEETKAFARQMISALKETL